MEAAKADPVPLERTALDAAASLTRAVDSALASLTAATPLSVGAPKVVAQPTVASRGKTRRDDAVRTEKVVLIGQGYVGLPVAIRAVEAGFRVVGLDVDADRVAKLAAGESYVEDINSSRLRAALQTGRYKPTCDYADAAGFDVCVVSVPTPLRDGVPDLSHIEQSGAALARYVMRDCTVILESTTYPGTTEELLQPLLEAGSGLRAPADFFLGYSPERIDPGNPAWHLENTPKVVSGIDAASLAKVDAFFRCIVDRTVPVGSTRVAELTKLLENTFRTMNIALVNELAIFADQLGIDVWQAIEAANTKPFGFMRLIPGPGVGGHCLPVDPAYLSCQVKRGGRHRCNPHRPRLLRLRGAATQRQPRIRHTQPLRRKQYRATLSVASSSAGLRYEDVLGITSCSMVSAHVNAGPLLQRTRKHIATTAG